MPDVAIVGAGDLGATLASIAASRDLARSIHLIDDGGQMAAGKALDIAQSAPVLGFSTRLSGGADLTTAAGARVVILADPARGDESASGHLAALQRLAFGMSGGVVICAGAGHRQLVELAVRRLRWPRTRIFGTAPEGMAAALRALVAIEVNGSPADVALTVLGVPPDHAVVPWADATIRGVAATRVLTEPARRRLAALTGPLWPPGPVTLAWAAVLAIEGILGGSRRTLSAFVGPDDSQGQRARAAALPVRLGPDGIEHIETPALTGRDQVELQTALQL